MKSKFNSQQYKVNFILALILFFLFSAQSQAECTYVISPADFQFESSTNAEFAYKLKTSKTFNSPTIKLDTQWVTWGNTAKQNGAVKLLIDKNGDGIASEAEFVTLYDKPDLDGSQYPESYIYSTGSAFIALWASLENFTLTKDVPIKLKHYDGTSTIYTDWLLKVICQAVVPPTTTGNLSVIWKEPVSDGMEMTGSIVYADGIVKNPNGVMEVRATFRDNSGHEYIGKQSRYNSVTEESFGIGLQPVSAGFSDNSLINITLGITDDSGNLIENIAARNFVWCLQSPCNVIVANTEPTFISGTVSSQTITQKGNLQFKSAWKDAENNPIVGVKVRYRRDGGALGIDYLWKEESLNYIQNTNPATFEKTVQIDETEGPYEFEFQASDVEQLGGAILHTTTWQGLGQFSVVTVLDNQPPKLQIIGVAPSSVMPGKPFNIKLQATDPNSNMRDIQIDWTGKGGSDGMVTAHVAANGEVIIPSHTYNLPLDTNLYWTATAYDTLDAKSNTVRGKVTIGRPRINTIAEKNNPSNKLTQNCSASCDPTLRGDPVNTATGSQIISFTLLKVDGLLPLSFSLAYDSAILDTQGMVGKAWSSNLSGTRLEQTPENDVLIHWSESQYNTFLLQGDGSYSSSDQRIHFDSLVKNADGSFTLTRQSKAIYTFNAAGQLQSIANPQGQQLTFEYDVAGRVSKVSEPVSKVFLSYQYNTAGLLDSVSDSSGRQVSFGYNVAGLLETITDAAKQTVTYSYDSAGRILKAVNSDNNVLFVNIYDADGRVLSQDDSNPNNQLLRFAYTQDASGNYVTTLTQRDGTVRVYTYTPAYQLLSLQDELNNVNQIHYDEFTGLPLEIISAKGAKTQLIYDDKGNLISGVNAKGVATQISYDALNNPIAITDILNNKNTFAYSDKQLLISATDAANQTTTLAYNNDNQLSTVTSPKGAVLQLEYQNGLVSKVTNAEGQTQLMTRDAAGRVVKITDAEGYSTDLVLDAVNRLVSAKDALGRTLITLTYNARDAITSMTDAKGNVTRFEYDDNGNRVKVTNALGDSTRFEYDAEDRLIKVIDAANQASQLIRDVTGRVVKTIDPLGNINEVQYDAAGNAVKQIDALGQTVVTLNYDILDNVTQATDALGNKASVEYDQLDRVVKSINPLNKATQYQYDVLSRVQKTVDALSGESSQTFDADGELISFKDPNQHETRSAFDKSGRIIEQTTTTGGKVSYRYDARDLLTELKNARGQVRTIEYDAVGRITQWTDEVSERAYQYDDNDNVLSVVDSVAGKVSFTYDKLDRILTYTDAQENKLSYTYDVIGNLTTLTYPDNKQVKYAYDARGALISVTDWANRVTRYSYDANGQVIKEERPNNTVLTKRYDAAGRLIEVQDLDSTGTAVVSFSYLYDAAGNIIEEQMLPEPDISAVQSMTMEYGIGNSLSKVDAQATPFDLDGNLLQAPLNGTLTDFAFNARNQLIKAANLDYGYDALGYRDVVKESGKTTRYVLNPVPALHQALIKIAPDSTKTFYVYGLGLIGEETNGKYLSYHFDYRGSTVALTANDGQVVNRFAYEPYGGLLGREALLQGTPFLFNGRYGVVTDPNGLYQMRARFYHPELRRFVNQDPVFLGGVEDSQNLNRFVFVTGNPVSLIDPFGLVLLIDHSLDCLNNGETTHCKQYENMNNLLQFQAKTGEEGFKLIGDKAGAKLMGSIGTKLSYLGAGYSTLTTYKKDGIYGGVKQVVIETVGICAGTAAGTACAVGTTSMGFAPAAMVTAPTCAFFAQEGGKLAATFTIDTIEDGFNMLFPPSANNKWHPPMATPNKWHPPMAVPIVRKMPNF